VTCESSTRILRVIYTAGTAVLPEKSRSADDTPSGESQEVSSVIERRMRRGYDVRHFSITSNIEMAPPGIWLLKRAPQYRKSVSGPTVTEEAGSLALGLLISGYPPGQNALAIHEITRIDTKNRSSFRDYSCWCG
jgi:hypothetical protein